MMDGLEEQESHVHGTQQRNDQNVVAIHCKAGRGRTGTIISSYLFYSGITMTANDALNYFEVDQVRCYGITG